MDPIAIQNASHSSWARPVAPPGADLTAILRQGRVVAGDVLQTFGGGSVLVGIGRHRVPARAQTELEAGRRYLFEVIGGSEPVELRVLGSSGGADAALLRALRGVLGADQPLGPMLERLRRELERSRSDDDPSDEALQRLLGAIDEQLFHPGADGAELANKLRGNGTLYEARWARLALDSSARDTLERLGRELARSLVVDWTGATGDDVADFQRAFAEALRELLRSTGLELGPALERWASGHKLGDLPRDVTTLLERALVRLPESPAKAVLIRQLRALDLESLPRTLRIALARALAGAGSAPESGDAGRLEVALEDVRRDLKSELLLARGLLTAGTARTAVERALANLEAEQLVNVARHTAHEPSHWSVPLRDGERWTTAHLFVHRDADRRQGRRPGEPEQQRLSLALELDRTGPLHVDILLRDDALALRVVASSESVAERLRTRLEELEQRLASTGRTVRTSLAVSPDLAHRSNDGVQGTRYLTDHHVLDMTG
ncbi:MAG: flagellar hook-length control protein FliK [Planctomycetes bacterium]|nr:flagellar hook-length control protein FliK [Planctomycetota bacterium]